MQGAVQRAFDIGDQMIGNAQSKTINLPEQATRDDIKRAYTLAFEEGCKGITVYRDNSRSFQVLSTSRSKEAVAPEVGELSAIKAVLAEGGDWFARLQPDGSVALEQFDTQMFSRQLSRERAATYARPPMIESMSYQVKAFSSEHGKKSYLVNVGHADGRVLEVQMVGGRAGEESNADSEALGRVISIALQNGVSPGVLIHTLRHISGNMQGTMQGRIITSKGDMIAVAMEDTVDRLEARLRQAGSGDIEVFEITEMPTDQQMHTDQSAPELAVSAGEKVISVPGGTTCQVCKQQTLVREEGCMKCLNTECGFSKCG